MTEKNDMALCDKQRENDWKAEFDRWVEPFLDEFEEDSQQRWCPVYLHGLLAPGERKSIEPMAARVCPGEVPPDVVFSTKWRIALDEIDRVLQSKIEFGYLLADAGYGSVPEFRHELSRRKLIWPVGVHSTTLVYSKNTEVVYRTRSHSTGRTPQIGTASEAPRTAQEVFAGFTDEVFVEVCWRNGTKGPLSLPFAAVRIRPADGPRVKGHNHGPGEEMWLICEKRTKTDLRYYLSNCPADTSLEKLAAIIKERWPCEQGHQQMKEELGLDHFEGRSWHGLHQHAVMTMLAFAFLQHLRMQLQPESQCSDAISRFDAHPPYDSRMADPHDAHGCVETNPQQPHPCQKTHGARWSAA